MSASIVFLPYIRNEICDNNLDNKKLFNAQFWLLINRATMRNPWTHSYSPISERLTIMKQKHLFTDVQDMTKKIIRWKANLEVFQFITNSCVANLLLSKYIQLVYWEKYFPLNRLKYYKRVGKTSWFGSTMSLFPDYLELQRNQSWASDQKSDSHIPRGSMNKLVMDYLITGK